MTIALVTGTHVSAQCSNGFSAVTTAGVNTTGANLLVVSLNSENQTGIGFLSDSYSNTWVELTEQTLFGVALTRLAYCLNPTVGAGHTFSWGHSDTQYWAITVAGFSGVATSSAFDKENGGTNSGAATITAPSLTPTNANSLVVSGMSYWNAQGSGIPAVSGGSYAITDAAAATGNAYPVALAYWVQTTATAAAASWSWTGNTNSTVTQAVFNAAAGGGDNLGLNHVCED